MDPLSLLLTEYYLGLSEDDRFYTWNNIDPERDWGDPEQHAFRLEVRAGRPLALYEDPFDALDELIRAALLYSSHPPF